MSDFHERRSVRASDEVVRRLMSLEHGLEIKLRLVRERVPQAQVDELEHELKRVRDCLYYED